MNKRDSERFRNLMLGMADNFRDTITEAGLMLRWRMLAAYTIDEVEKAGFEIIRRRKYTKMPPVAEFITEIEGERAPVELVAERQWSIIMGEVRRVGSYGTPQITDPITALLFATRFRFSEICRAGARDMAFIHREFVAAYNAESIIGYNDMIDYHRQRPDMQGLAGGVFKAIEH